MLERVERRRRVGVEPRLERAQRVRARRCAASIALKPSRSARAACAGMPAMSTWNQSTPTWATVRWSGCGSVMHAGVGARAVEQALQRAVAGALLLDDGLQLHGRGRAPRRRAPAPRTAPVIAASPAFMSQAPRP